MSLAIRMKRTGRKNRPHYSIVVAESGNPRDGRYLEELGKYDPYKAESPFTLDKERAAYWISKGAKPSDTVRSFLKKSGN